MKSERKSLSKTTRFEVFKRDVFTCQYCGRNPPVVTLELDHINPVSNGGNDDFENLVTSCFDCNRGKGSRLLSSIPKSLSDTAQEIAEKELQIKGYYQTLKLKKLRVERELNKINALYFRLIGCQLQEAELIKIRRLIEKLGFETIKDAMEIAFTRSDVRYPLNYFFGVCFTKIKQIKEYFDE